MHWVLLVAAGLLEIVWAVALKQSHGLTRLAPSLVAGAALLGSLALLAQAMRALPLGVAYPVWTGIGALGAVLAGLALGGEAPSLLRGLAAVLILAGVVLMKASAGS
ncbi:multidrug efflux SMR transporter [Albimonas sp. CAU 1670]|uniref:DMT family transporter n=1 Tax=Albimonas sp. CAU 1670 TaxID=3032599 RepID=UPI0023DAAF21|nr:multidrug efflux SMR transporter [Albimonas sp. CAU 1670]MDF2234014.1 multidrug efflux SMR transporter [Albimonas sp. CAU 1670]